MKKIIKISVILFTIISVIYVGYKFIPQDPKLQNNSGDSLSYLSEFKGSPTINVFNFENEKIIKKFKIPKEKDLYSSTAYHKNQKKSVIVTQQLEPYGYQVFIQDENEIKKIGLIKEPIHEAIVLNNYLYVLVYLPNQNNKVTLKKYDVSNIEKPIKSWSLNGLPERMLVDELSNNIYILTVDNNTALFTLNTNTEELKKTQVFDKPYDLNAFLKEGELWLLLQEQLTDMNIKSQKGKIPTRLVMSYNLKNKKVEKKLDTNYPPKFIQIDNNKVYVISGNSNTSYLEIYNTNSFSKESAEVLKLDIGNINGFINKKYIFSDKGIYKIQNGAIKSIVDETISADLDLIIH
ncbi:YncE family protein [Bacillus sp. 179-C3.3 HS]|uniref:YncE family protein n=1 Tax=Bacillus sp. 179-C3.3 HS TaxID=3232162 RepID=UPI0039A3F154